MESGDRFVKRTMTDGKVRTFYLVRAKQVTQRLVEATLRATQIDPDTGERFATGPWKTATGGFASARHFVYERAERAAIECAIALL